MNDFFTLHIGFDSYHLIFPWAIGTILVVLLVIMGIQKIVTVSGRKSADTGGTRPRFRFFDKGFNAKMLVGALACIVIYALVLDLLGFLISSILFIVALSLVFRPVFTPRALVGVGLNAVLTPFVIWLVFGQLFDITLP